MPRPETRYATSGDVSIAYQVVGDAPRDLVFVPGATSHLEYNWEHPGFARYLERLASFSRLILFDKRGTGLSDRVGGAPTLEQRMDDVRAVMDAAGSHRAALYGASEGGPMSILFAATYPERTTGLILYGTYARHHWAPDYPWRLKEPTPDEWEETKERTRRTWGTDEWLAEQVLRLHPEGVDDPQFRRWLSDWIRYGSSPASSIALREMNRHIDVRHVLPAIRVPTLVIHRTGDRVASIENGRYLAAHIPGARLVEQPGDSHMPFATDADEQLAEIEEFLTGARTVADADRVLATVLFVDVVGSTERAARVGDRRWAEELQSFYAAVRRELTRFRGREVDTAGDGLLATFDGPARAIRCARAIADGARTLGLAVRTGLHTGEVELVGDAVRGIAVHIGARVASLACAGEVLVSSTVRDLVSGSGIPFAERGTHVLKGVEGEWRLYAVQAS